jgi:hypothetical protein
MARARTFLAGSAASRALLLANAQFMRRVPKELAALESIAAHRDRRSFDNGYSVYRSR